MALFRALQVLQVHGPGLKMPSVHDGKPVLQGVRCLALRCNNTELISCGSDGRICIHDITGERVGSILQTLQVQIGFLDGWCAFLLLQRCCCSGHARFVSTACYWCSNMVSGALHPTAIPFHSHVLQFQHPAQLGAASFRALDVRPGGVELLLGTHCCDLWELNPSAATTVPAAVPGGAPAVGRVLPEPLIQGHNGDVWGIAYHPLKPHHFVTACESNSIFCWHGKRRQLMVSMHAILRLSDLCTCSQLGAGLMVCSPGLADRIFGFWLVM